MTNTPTNSPFQQEGECWFPCLDVAGNTLQVAAAVDMGGGLL